MLAYAIKVYLVDGYWGYVRLDGNGGFELTKDESTILCFATLDEVREFYQSTVRGASCNGVPVDTTRTAYVRVNY